MKPANLFAITILTASVAAAQALPAEQVPAQAAKKAAAPARAATATRTVKDLKFKPLKELKLPDIATFNLPNGMKVYLLENHELPLIRGSARIRTGSVLIPAEKTGLAGLFGSVMRTGGTKDKTGDQINEILEGMAASVEGGVGSTSATFGFNALKENTDEVMALFKDLLTAPEFRQDKLDLAKSQTRGSISRRNDDAHGIAGREFRRILYGKTTPWGRQTEYETLDRITRQDLIDFHKRYYFPANVSLAIQGDFNSTEMRAKLEKLFADWTVKQPAPPQFPPVNHTPVPGVYSVEKKEVNQTNFYIGHLGGTLRDKDYPVLEVMADILGGGFTSRLVKKVRSDLGLAYSVNANWSAEFDHPGMFLIGGGTKSESTVQALKVIREEVEKIRTTPVTDLELTEAKESTLNSFVFNFDSPSEVLNRLVNYEYYGYPKDWIFEYQKAIAAVTKADILRVAKEYLKPENFVIVTVGKPEDYGTPLTALNLPVSKVDITIPEPKRETGKADAASLAKGKELLQKLQKAVGGAEKLAAVKDYSHTAQVTVMSMQGMKVTQTVKILPPAARLEQVLPFGKMTIYSDGAGGGFMIGPQGTAALPPPAAKQIGEELFRLHPTLWTSDRNPDRTINAVDANTIEITDKQGHYIKLQLDPTSGLPVKANYRGDGGADTEATYEGWMETNGLKLPAKVKISQGGKPAAEMAISEYKLNSGLTTEELSKK